MNIGIIGSGVVGGATGKAFSRHGFAVTFGDINHDVLKKLNHEGHFIADNISLLIEESDVVFICVNTPTNDDEEQDLTQIESVIPDLISGVYNSKILKTIILRSTVLPTTSEWFLKTLQTKMGSMGNWQFFYNPEFLTSSNALSDALHPDRIIIGGKDVRSWDVIDELYPDDGNSIWGGCEIIKTGLAEAEMIKYMSNCFLATKISYFNEMGQISDTLNLDKQMIEHAVSLDRRIGSYGTHSGKPFGGMCLPKDVKAFYKMFKSKSELLGKVLEVNDR